MVNATIKTIELADGRTITIETGKLAKQADGAVVVRMGETMLLATVVSAKEAKELGLVNVVVWNNSVLKIALEKYAEKFASMPTKAIGMIKNMLNNSFSNDLNTMLEQESIMQDIAGNSEDYKEGVNSFLEKRKPKFKGK